MKTTSMFLGLILSLIFSVVLLTGSAALAAPEPTVPDAPTVEPAPKVPKKEWVELKAICFDFAFNPETGSLAGLDAPNNTITLYPKAYLEGTSETVIGPVEIGAMPLRIVYKKYKEKVYFCVFHYADGLITVLDAKTLKKVATIPTVASQATGIATPTDPNNPFLYYCYGGDRSTGVGRARIDTMVDEGKLGIDRLAKEIDVSADGQTLYLRGPWRKSGFEAFQLVPGEKTKSGTWERVGSEGASSGSHSAGPFNQRFAASGKLFSANLTQVVAPLTYYPKCFFPVRPIMAGISSGDLVVGSANDFKRLGVSPLPKGFFKTDGWKRPLRDYYYSVRLFADGPNDRLLAVHGNRAILKPLSLFDLPDEPILMSIIQAPKSDVTVGRSVTIPVTPIDARAAVSIETGPKGMVLKGGSLVWTPTVNDLGPAKVVLKTSHKGKSVSRRSP